LLEKCNSIAYLLEWTVHPLLHITNKHLLRFVKWPQLSLDCLFDAMIDHKLVDSEVALPDA
jgi:hypothetical protein